MIQGSNDGETWTTLWTSPAEAASTTDYTVITEFENNTGYRYFRYFNETNHGDVAEVEFYGAPGTAAAEAPVETPVETPATTAPVTTAPQTGDILVIAAIALVASLGTAVVAKKH